MGLTGFDTLVLENKQLRPRSRTVDPGSHSDLLMERRMREYEQLDTSSRLDLGISEVAKNGKDFYILKCHPRNFRKHPLR